MGLNILNEPCGIFIIRIFIALLFFSDPVLHVKGASEQNSFGFIPDSFKLVDEDCKTIGVIHLENSISTKPTFKGVSDCSLNGDKMSCDWYSSGNTSKASTRYSVILNQDGYIVGRSASGNINLIVDFNKKRFNHGQVNILATLSMVSKVCTGKIM